MSFCEKISYSSLILFHDRRPIFSYYNHKLLLLRFEVVDSNQDVANEANMFS